jgi:hypothetical protein
MVSPEHDMVVVFTASVGDDEYDPEFDLYSNYILRSISVGPDSEFSSNLLLEALTDLAILFTATAVISIIIVKRERKN